MSLADLYRTKKEEDSEFQEDLLIKIAFNLVSALSQHFYKSMLRMEMVYFTDVVSPYLTQSSNILGQHQNSRTLAPDFQSV